MSPVAIFHPTPWIHMKATLLHVTVTAPEQRGLTMMTKEAVMTKQRVWMVTGCSRGLGRALGEEVLAGGDLLIATARDPKTLIPLVERYGPKILPVAVDVRNPAQVRSAMDSVGVVNVTRVADAVPDPACPHTTLQSAYHAAKFAVEGLASRWRRR